MAGRTRRSLFQAEPLPTRRHPGPRPRKGAAAGSAEVQGFVAGLPTGDDRGGSARSRLAALVTAAPPTLTTPAGIAVLDQNVVLSRRRAWDPQDFDHLDAVSVSDILRPIEALARRGSDPACGEATARHRTNPDLGLR